MSGFSILFLIIVLIVSTIVGGFVPLVGHVCAALVVYICFKALVMRAVEGRVGYLRKLANAASGAEKQALLDEIDNRQRRVADAAALVTIGAIIVAAVTFVHPWIGLLALVCGGISWALGFAKG